MTQKNELKIFFTALITISVMVGGGVAYFKTHAQPQGLLADITAPAQQEAPPIINTIPTSTVVAPVVSTSTPLMPLNLPYSFNASTSNEMYWPRSWGNISFINTGIALIPDPITRGANSFLNGASAWANYTVSANVSWLRGGWFDIVARTANDTKDFVYCEFGANGTFIIERVDTADKQIAFSEASTTDNVAGATENFGMKVYGNDIACMMNNQEVVGVHVDDQNESPTGGIGFVIFRAPAAQKQVNVTNVLVAPLLKNTIVAPFPVAPEPVVPPPVVVTDPTPPAPAPTPTPAPTAPTSTPPTKPAPPVALTLPYTETTFTGDKNWSATWGKMTVNPFGFIDMTPQGDTGAEIRLENSTNWSNYTFTANLNWVSGQQFGLMANYHNNGNLILCKFDEQNPGDFIISLHQYAKGKDLTLTQSAIFHLNDFSDKPNINASIEVDDVHGWCSLNGHEISNSIPDATTYLISAPYNGGIGIMTWDPKKNNSELIVNSVSVQANH